MLFFLACWRMGIAGAPQLIVLMLARMVAHGLRVDDYITANSWLWIEGGLYGAMLTVWWRKWRKSY